MYEDFECARLLPSTLDHARGPFVIDERRNQQSGPPRTSPRFAWFRKHDSGQSRILDLYDREKVSPLSSFDDVRLKVDLKTGNVGAIADIIHEDPRTADKQRKRCGSLLDDVDQHLDLHVESQAAASLTSGLANGRTSAVSKLKTLDDSYISPVS
jgi:hypothetical protein